MYISIRNSSFKICLNRAQKYSMISFRFDFSYCCLSFNNSPRICMKYLPLIGKQTSINHLIINLLKQRFCYIIKKIERSYMKLVNTNAYVMYHVSYRKYSLYSFLLFLGETWLLFPLAWVKFRYIWTLMINLIDIISGK